jgi:capsule polysaccharide export protein KpsE/RkpR
MGTSSTFEDLHTYFDKQVSADFDTGSSITTLKVRAFNPKDAQRFNEALLKQSEALVNRLNERGRRDLIGYAQNEVEQARKEADTAATQLAEYRNTTGVLDPEKQASVQLQMISKLQDKLILTRNQLAELEATVPRTPDSEPEDPDCGAQWRNRARKRPGGR